MAYKEAIHVGKIQSISWASCLATMYVFTNQYVINNQKIIHWFFNQGSYTSSDIEFMDFSRTFEDPIIKFWGPNKLLLRQIHHNSCTISIIYNVNAWINWCYGTGIYSKPQPFASQAVHTQGFWCFARSRSREIQVNPRNPAKFTKTRKIPRNSVEILSNTCLYSNFETCLSYWGYLLAVSSQIYEQRFETTRRRLCCEKLGTSYDVKGFAIGSFLECIIVERASDVLC